MADNTSVSVLSRALDQAGDVLGTVHDDHLSLPTPCHDWDVAQLIAHLVNDPRTFVSMARGEDVDWSAPPPAVTSGWAQQFRAAADDLAQAWHGAGDDVEPGPVDMQTAEFALHTWDLAQAIGYAGTLDPEVAERGLAFMSHSLSDENRGDAFAAEVAAPEGASAYERLAAFSGRTVT